MADFQAPETAAAVFARALRARWPLVILVMLAALGGTLFVLSRGQADYEATAEVLITPVPPADQAFLGLDFIRESGEPTRTAQTAAALLESRAAAEAAARKAGGWWTRELVEEILVVEPQGESNIIAITATAGDPAVAATIANEYARASLSARFKTLRRQIGVRLEQLRAERRRLPPTDFAQSDLAEQVNKLQSIRAAGRDPTLALSQAATAPVDPSGTPPYLVAGLALLAGFALGSMAAIAIEFFNRRVRDEEELLRLYPLPILARVPPVPRRLRRRGVVSPFAMPPVAREAFRTLRTQLEQRTGPQRTVMLASASSGDGKTTSAASLAVALVDADYSVILIDFDLRKAELAPLVGVEPERGLGSILTEGAELSDLLVESPYAPGLRVLPAVPGDSAFLEALLRRLPEVLSEAQELADYVVLDTAPLGEVSDALRVAGQVDDVILVVRPKNTNRRSFEQVRDLLERSAARPTGLLVTGQAAGASRGYYAYGAPAPADASAGSHSRD